ncbi:hypothetical protein ABAC460_06400 [Asticcacaulis sp. AC460]|uniref:YcxB family protein n=1 Tax=Asticcacaulis sp. AC460 TaxID=1282360 RepID=UPI0003C3B1B5|nr:YcxB family protein [Asticcacaulis sp. AC460]ESQ91189.1 hypothetical protein ABAC460_06400 [Asticcacaulis sp. AC460]
MTEAEITTQPFKIRPRDHLHYMLAAYYRGLLRWPWVIFYVLQIFGVPLLLNLADVREGRVSGFLIGLGIMLLLWGLVVPTISIVRAVLSFQRNPLMSGARSIRLTDRSLVVEGPGLFSELTWSNFLKAERNKTHLYIYMTAATAQAIPVSAFPSREAADAFLDRARRLIQHSKHGQAVVFETPVTPTPNQTELQSAPFTYDFGTHFRVYPTLFYGAMRSIGIIGVVMVLAILLSQNGWALTETGRTDLWPELIGMTVIIPAILLILPLIIAPMTWLALRKQAGIRGSRVAALSDDRLVVHGASFHTELKLADLTRVRRTRHIMLFMTRPNCAIVVPISAFASPEDANTFFDRASAQWKAKHARPAAKTHLDGKS